MQGGRRPPYLMFLVFKIIGQGALSQPTSQRFLPFRLA